MRSSGISLIKVYAPTLHFIVFRIRLLIVGFYNNHLGVFPFIITIKRYLLKDHASVVERTDFSNADFWKADIINNH